MRRSLAVLVVFVLSISSLTSPAFAGTAAVRWTDKDGIGAGVSTGTPTGSGSGGRVPVCTYYKLGPAYDAPNETERKRQLKMGNQRSAEFGAWYSKTCVDEQGNSDSEILWVVQAEPRDLARQALEYVPVATPSIHINPALDREQIVNLPSWYWLEGGAWTAQSASASDAGVTATTTATPTRVVWDSGDGTQTICDGPGVAYDPAKLASDQNTNCSHVYRRSSAGEPGGRFKLTATVEWNVTWTATGLSAGEPATGSLDIITRTATASIRVAEIQALNK